MNIESSPDFGKRKVTESDFSASEYGSDDNFAVYEAKNSDTETMKVNVLRENAGKRKKLADDIMSGNESTTAFSKFPNLNPNRGEHLGAAGTSSQNAKSDGRAEAA